MFYRVGQSSYRWRHEEPRQAQGEHGDRLQKHVAREAKRQSGETNRETGLNCAGHNYRGHNYTRSVVRRRICRTTTSRSSSPLSTMTAATICRLTRSLASLSAPRRLLTPARGSSSRRSVSTRQRTGQVLMRSCFRRWPA